MPYAHLSITDYGKRMEEWLQAIIRSEPPPEEEDVSILKEVMKRILTEFELEITGCPFKKTDSIRIQAEEPMRGFVHGPPGTGKSRLIFRIRKLFLDALGWEHGVQYMCVAFQNRVAYAMQGVTLHAGGEVPVGAAHRSLEHSDVDSLFTQKKPSVTLGVNRRGRHDLRQLARNLRIEHK